MPFDVESLFTNVPIRKTINVILTRIYNDHTISTNLEKRSLKKLILDICTKTTFSFNNVIYKQKDGVSMGFSLGRVMANIMTKLEDKVIKSLINDGTIKFYCRYVDDTLHVVKPQDVSGIHKLLTSFDKNLKFTTDLFENEVPHFLDLGMSPNGISIYRKDTNTGLYVNYTSFVPSIHRTTWIRILVTCVLRTCSSNKLPQELKLIKKFASGNDFPKHTVNSIFCKTRWAHEDKSEPNPTAKQKEPVAIYFRFPYYGDKGLLLLKSYIRKIKVNCKNDHPVIFKILHDVCKMEFFCNTKYRTPIINQSFVVYEVTCPGRSADYEGKTERTLYERYVEHAWSNQNSVVKDHLEQCVEVQYLLNITSLGPALFSNDSNIENADNRNSRINLAIDNTFIIDRYKNFNILLFKEALKINERKPTLKKGLKASNELQLF